MSEPFHIRATETSGDFSLGIQMEEARKRMLHEVGSIDDEMKILENIHAQDVRRWANAFLMTKSFVEYDEAGEQADYLRTAEFDLDAYNRVCEEIERAFLDWECVGDEEKDGCKETVMCLFEELRKILGKRLIKGARL